MYYSSILRCRGNEFISYVYFLIMARGKLSPDIVDLFLSQPDILIDKRKKSLSACMME